jgi:DNA repair exonuclease SbcCD ATPase subunit
MKFLSIRVQNFMSIRKLKLKLANRGIILMTGRNLDNPSSNSNGSGKSSLWDALIWALYGRVLRDDVGADDVINERSTGGCAVTVRIKDDDGRVWTVFRSRGVKSSPSLDLRCNDRDAGSAASAATQDKINNLLGTDFYTFASSILFGQDSLRFATLTDREKKTVLERLLGLDLYEKAYKLVCSKISAQKMILELQKASWLHALEEIKELEAKLVDNEEKNRQERKQIKANLRTLKKSLREKKAEHERLQAEVEKGELREAKLLRLQNEKRDAQAEAARSKDLYEEYNEEEATLREHLHDVLHERGSLCPTCGQEMDREGRAKAKSELKTRLGALRGKAEAMERRYRRHRKIGARLKRRLEKSGWPNELAGLRADCSKAGASVSALRTTFQYTKKNRPVSSQSIADLEEQIKKLKSKATSDNEEITKAKRLYEKRKYWQQGFSPVGIRSFILDGVVPFLNERANHYASILTDGRIRIGFDTVTKLKNGEYKEKFAVKATNSDGSSIYGGNSAGERQRVDLCVALALKDLARSRSKNNLDLMVFDEAFERLDEAGSERVITLLNEERKNFGSCFVISHTDALKQYFTERVEVVKEDGHTRLERHV